VRKDGREGDLLVRRGGGEEGKGRGGLAPNLKPNFADGHGLWIMAEIQKLN